MFRVSIAKYFKNTLNNKNTHTHFELNHFRVYFYIALQRIVNVFLDLTSVV